MSKYKDKKPSMIEFTRKYFLCNNILTFGVEENKNSFKRHK